MSHPKGESGYGGVRGIGEVDDGKVRATVVDGRLESVDVEPRLLRSDLKDTIPHIVEAVNAALADYRARLHENIGVPYINPRALLTGLREACQQYELNMRQAAERMQENLAELRKDGIAPIDPPTADFGSLIDDLTRVLDKVDDAATGSGEALTGTGESARGKIKAVCVPDNLLDSLNIEPRAVRGTVELDEHVVRAVNAAMDDLALKLRHFQADAGVDPQAINATLHELREQNRARFESYAQAASAFAASVGPQR